jgi:site-specific DNA-cytosine methylase
MGISTLPIIYFNKENRFRYLTPIESFRLMGFLNDEIKLEGLSDSACYKLAGNGWEINLASKVLKNMLNTLQEQNDDFKNTNILTKENRG